MRGRELLNATNNVWRVKCWRDGNRRRIEAVLFVRAACVLSAERQAQNLSGCKCVDASPWDPRKEAVFGRYIQEAAE